MGKGRKMLVNGRNAVDQYCKIPYGFFQSPAWRSLNGSAVKVWLELRTRYNGSNNGKIILSFEDAAKTLGLGKATIKRALQELQDKGFIRLTKKGFWYGRQASEWAITSLHLNGYPPTDDWKQYNPASKTNVGSKSEHELPTYVP